jgi:TPR repeat protein
MPVVRLIAVVVLSVLPSATGAQTWSEAYRAKEYERAAELLHAIVAEAEQPDTSVPPEPFHHLALLYANGHGVPRDPIIACTLAQMAYAARERVSA